MNLMRSSLKRVSINSLIKILSFLRANGSVLQVCQSYIEERNTVISNSSASTAEALKFDSTTLDRYILKSARALTAGRPKLRAGLKPDPSKVCILATRTYDSGGHTECILRLMDFLADFKLYYIERNPVCSNPDRDSGKLKSLAERAETSLMTLERDSGRAVSELYEAIVSTNAGNVVSFIHPQDAVSAGVLGLLKEYTSIHIIYNVHADHLLNLGLSFADVVLVGRQASQKALARYLSRPPIISSVAPCYARTFTFDENDVREEKRKLGLSDDHYVTLTGCPAYKIFKDPDLPYWRLIKRLLTVEPKLKHIFISSLTVGQRRALEALFSDSPGLLERIIFLEPGARFPLYINVADLFIDSFPMGSALTHIDVIREKRPTIIKINDDDPFLSFQDYLYDGYEYCCHTPDEMFDSILYLLHNPNVRAEVGRKVFQFSEERYAFERLKVEMMSYLRL